MYLLQRTRRPVAIEAFKVVLVNHDWNEVYVEDTNDSYNAFLDTSMLMYNYYCPIRKIKVKYKNEHNSWMTRGLENSCKKKKLL